MSWQIAVVENDVKINKKIAKELFDALDGEEYWFEPEDVVCDGKISFNPDHMEHMDFLWKDEAQKILKKNKVKGRVCFGSLDGDNAGSFWGYEFDGKGGVKSLDGTVVWSVK